MYKVGIFKDGEIGEFMLELFQCCICFDFEGNFIIEFYKLFVICILRQVSWYVYYFNRYMNLMFNRIGNVWFFVQGMKS